MLQIHTAHVSYARKNIISTHLGKVLNALMFMSVVNYAHLARDDTRKKNLEKILKNSGELGEGGHEKVGL